MNTGNRIGDSYTSRESPNYPVQRVISSLSIAAVLMIVTIGAMLYTANTPLADAFLFLYDLGAIVGVIAIGALLTAGRFAGMRGAKNDNYLLMTIGVGVLVFTYGTFGGAILQLFPSDIWLTALTVTAGITIGITLIAGTYVYTTNKDMSHWGDLSAIAFLAGLIVAAAGTIFSSILVVAFVLFFLGFIFDLIYEIWKVSSAKHSPLTNGIGVYVAFAGVFVHVLQLVLHALTDD